MTLVVQRLALVLMLALGLSTVWVATTALAAPGGGLASAAYAQDDDGGDDDGGDDDGGDDDGGDDNGGDDRDDVAPEGGVETGGGGTAEQDRNGTSLLVPVSLASLATVGGGLLLWRRQIAQQ